MHLNIFVSQKCFLYCKGCYSFSRVEKCGQIIPTEKIVSFLKYAYKNGTRKVTLCGGDPLTRKDIIDLLKKIKKIGFKISLDTVGTSIIRAIKQNGNTIIKKTSAKQLAKLVDNIGIPIDGSTTEIIKLFRQSNSNILDEQIQICEQLRKYNANICINTVVHKGNLNDACNLANLIKNLDYINQWQIFQYAPMGKYGLLNRDQFEISEADFNRYKSNVLSVIANNNIQFKTFKERNNIYMIIDNSGNAWIPIYDKKVFKDKTLKIEERKLIGNINNINDWDKICCFLKKGGDLK